jgi:hypothetical protein
VNLERLDAITRAQLQPFGTSFAQGATVRP